MPKFKDMDEATRRDVLLDSTYIAGLKAGYNLGVIEDQETLNEIIEHRVRERAAVANSRKFAVTLRSGT